MSMLTDFNNLKYSNYLFSLILKKNNLVVNSDTLFEITKDVNNAISFNFLGISSRVYPDINHKEIDGFINDENINLIHNGELINDVNFLSGRIINNGSINVGICTSDEIKYRKEIEKYKRMKQVLETKYNVEVRSIEKDIEQHKVYMLSYRHK